MIKRCVVAVASAAVGVSLLGTPALAAPSAPSPSVAQQDVVDDLGDLDAIFSPPQKVTPHQVGLVKLGMTRRDAVRAAKLKALPGCKRSFMGADKTWLGFRMALLNKSQRVQVLLTFDTGDSTPKGVAPGDTLRKVQRAYPKASLRTIRHEGERAHVITIKSGRDRLVIPFENRRPGAKSFVFYLGRDLTARQIMIGKFAEPCLNDDLDQRQRIAAATE